MVRRNSFRFFAVEYVAEGYGSFTCHGLTTQLQPGMLYGYAPGSAHVITSSAEQPLVKYFLDFSGAEAKRSFDRLPLGEAGSIWMRQPRVIQDLFQQIVDAGQEVSQLSQRLCCAIFGVLLLRLDQNAMRQEEAASGAFETYERAYQELRIGYQSLRSAADVAQRLDITPAYLARLFQRYSNTSPHRALTAMKMAEAASLLVATSMGVTEVAARVGYSDPYHFSRVFKSSYGRAPMHFRVHPRGAGQTAREMDIMSDGASVETGN
ncbi:MAG: AraC family transcriptional regulator [Acidobacteria bacterium]|nr:AraC family transcriptional regulator [Acidobacteriota bacterium]